MWRRSLLLCRLFPHVQPSVINNYCGENNHLNNHKSNNNNNWVGGTLAAPKNEDLSLVAFVSFLPIAATTPHQHQSSSMSQHSNSNDLSANFASDKPAAVALHGIFYPIFLTSLQQLNAVLSSAATTSIEEGHTTTDQGSITVSSSGGGGGGAVTPHQSSTSSSSQHQHTTCSRGRRMAAICLLPSSSSSSLQHQQQNLPHSKRRLPFHKHTAVREVGDNPSCIRIELMIRHRSTNGKNMLVGNQSGVETEVSSSDNCMLIKSLPNTASLARRLLLTNIRDQRVLPPSMLRPEQQQQQQHNSNRSAIATSLQMIQKAEELMAALEELVYLSHEEMTLLSFSSKSGQLMPVKCNKLDATVYDSSLLPDACGAFIQLVEEARSHLENLEQDEVVRRDETVISIGMAVLRSAVEGCAGVATALKFAEGRASSRETKPEDRTNTNKTDVQQQHENNDHNASAAKIFVEMISWIVVKCASTSAASVANAAKEKEQQQQLNQVHSWAQRYGRPNPTTPLELQDSDPLLWYHRNQQVQELWCDKQQMAEKEMRRKEEASQAAQQIWSEIPNKGTADDSIRKHPRQFNGQWPNWKNSSV